VMGEGPRAWKAVSGGAGGGAACGVGCVKEPGQGLSWPRAVRNRRWGGLWPATSCEPTGSHFFPAPRPRNPGTRGLAGGAPSQLVQRATEVWNPSSAPGVGVGRGVGNLSPGIEELEEQRLDGRGGRAHHRPLGARRSMGVESLTQCRGKDKKGGSQNKKQPMAGRSSPGPLWGCGVGVEPPPVIWSTAGDPPPCFKDRQHGYKVPLLNSTMFGGDRGSGEMMGHDSGAPVSPRVTCCAMANIAEFSRGTFWYL